MSPILTVRDLRVVFGGVTAVDGVSFDVAPGQLLGLIGPNGAGKTTVMRSITGIVRPNTGVIELDGQRLSGLPIHQRMRRGLALSQQLVRPFREMTVIENLFAGAYLVKEKSQVQKNLANVYQLFPRLEERSKQISGTLSGGEQQMLAIGRALMSNPKLLCIDEPSTGLAPIMKEEVFRKIGAIKKMGITVLLVEQEVNAVFALASRNYVLSSGKIIAEGTGDELLKDEVLRKTYLGL